MSDHDSEETESLPNSQSPVKASMEKPVQVSGQPPQVVLVNKMSALNHHAPLTPSLRTNIKSQNSQICELQVPLQMLLQSPGGNQTSFTNNSINNIYIHARKC